MDTGTLSEALTSKIASVSYLNSGGRFIGQLIFDPACCPDQREEGDRDTYGVSQCRLAATVARKSCLTNTYRLDEEGELRRERPNPSTVSTEVRRWDASNGLRVQFLFLLMCSASNVSTVITRGDGEKGGAAVESRSLRMAQRAAVCQASALHA